MEKNVHALPTKMSNEPKPTLLTARRLAEITVRVLNADQGPWRYDDQADGRSYGYIRQGESRPAPWPAIAQASHIPGRHTRENGQFIAYAREDVPALLAEITVLRHYLLAHGAHAENCVAHSTFGIEQCTCGFGTVLAQLNT